MINLGSSDLAIGISLVMDNQFSSGVPGALSSYEQLSAGANAAIAAHERAQRSYNAAGAAMGGAAVGMMANMVKLGAEFDATIKYISLIADEKNGIGFDKLSKRALQLGQDSMYSAGQVSDAMKYLAMSGMDTEDIYNNVAGAVALASATMSQLEGKLGTADIMTNVMKAFDIRGTEENALYVADVLAKAVTSSNTNLTDFAEAMKYAQATAKGLNLSLEETSALIMLAGDAGIQGSMAGTATENMLRYLSRVTDESRKDSRQGKGLAVFGLTARDLKDARGELLPLSEIFAKLTKHAQGMSNPALINAMQDIFGVRGAREALLVFKHLESYDKHLNTLNNNAQGTALINQQTMMKTLKGLLDEAWGTLETFAVVWTDQLQPVLNPLVKAFSTTVEFINKMISTPVGKWFVTLASGWIVAKTAIMGYRTIVLSLRGLQGNLLQSTIQTTAATTRGNLTATTATSTYHGALSKVVGKLTQQKLTQEQVNIAQVKYANELQRTIAAENSLTAAQRRRVSTVAATVAASGSKNVTGMGPLGIMGAGATAGLGLWLARAGIGNYSYVDSRGRQRAISGRGFGSDKYIKTGSRPLGYNIPGGMAVSNIAKYVNKGSGVAMLGGMALEGIGSSVGGETGKYMSVAGSTLGMAGTGAMLGSMIGPWGTVIGGVVGGAIGLITSLQSSMEDAENAVNKANQDAENAKANQFWREDAWRAKARKILSVKPGDQFHLQSQDMMIQDDAGRVRNAVRNSQFLPKGDTTLIINIDGKKEIDKLINQATFDEIINLDL